MRIRIERNDTVFEFERKPLSEGRFRALCKLAGAAISGAVLLIAIHFAGVWAIAGALGALLLYGFYKMTQDI